MKTSLVQLDWKGILRRACLPEDQPERQSLLAKYSGACASFGESVGAHSNIYTRNVYAGHFRRMSQTDIIKLEQLDRQRDDLRRQIEELNKREQELLRAAYTGNAVPLAFDEIKALRQSASKA